MIATYSPGSRLCPSVRVLWADAQWGHGTHGHGAVGEPCRESKNYACRSGHPRPVRTLEENSAKCAASACRYASGVPDERCCSASLSERVACARGLGSRRGFDGVLMGSSSSRCSLLHHDRLEALGQPWLVEPSPAARGLS